MTYKIIIKDETELDTEIAYDYYEKERKGLGEEFLQELIKKYDTLSSNPQHYGFINDQRDFRGIKIGRFPYIIVFEVIDDSVIVHAVRNTHNHLKKRLR